MSESTLLKILRILAWPYRFPPLSWVAALINWLAASRRRFWAVVVVGAVVQVSMVVMLCVR